MTTHTRSALFALLMIAAATAPAFAQQAPDSAAAAWNAGDHARARELYAAKLRTDAGDLQAMHRLGLLLAWDRSYDEGIAWLTRRVEARESIDALLDLARVTSWAGRYAAASRHYERVLTLDPGNVQALRGLAQVATWSGDMQEGERRWRQLLAVAPEDAATRVGLSQVLRWTGRPREALQHAAEAVRLEHANADALEQLAWAEAAFDPRVAAFVTTETDSDENTATTATFSAVTPVSRRVSLSGRMALRMATGLSTDFMAPPMDLDRESRSAALTASAEIGAGWMLSATSGVIDLGGSTDPALTLGASFASPAWRRLTVTAAFERTALDYTADLMQRGVEMTGGTLGTGLRVHRALRIEAAAALTRFEGEQTNRRWLVRSAAEGRVTRSLRVRPRALVFGFEKQAREGYFAPDRYVLVESGLGMERWHNGWSIGAEVAPGVQQVGSDGDARGTLAGRLNVSYSLAPGRAVTLLLSSSNMGMSNLQAGDASYRHRSAGLSLSWGF